MTADLIPTSVGYYDRLKPTEHPEFLEKWLKILFRPSKFIQAAELNELQTMMTYQMSLFAGSFFPSGTYVEGGGITVTPGVPTGLDVHIAVGILYAAGYFHNVPAGLVNITGVGEEHITLEIGTEVSTAEPVLPPSYVAEPLLSDPVIGAEAFNKPSADRENGTYQFSLNGPGYVIAVFIDGQLVTPPDNGALAQFYAALALRLFELLGPVVTTEPEIVITDIAALETNPVNLRCSVTDGVFYVKGNRFTNIGPTLLNFSRPMTGYAVNGEPHQYNSGTFIYPYNLPLWEPNALSMTELEIIIDSPSFIMVRGASNPGSDAIPVQYTPTGAILSVSDGVNGTYTQGVDYDLVGNNVHWLNSGTAPLTGANYNVEVRYVKILEKGIRTLTDVLAEPASVSGPTLATTQQDLGVISEIKRLSDSFIYVEGVDYTYSANTGLITWLIQPTNGTAITITYTWWDHTVEGDFTCRDSFVNSLNEVQWYLTPTKTPNGYTVDYKKQFSLDTTSGNLPVDGTFMQLEYTYAQGRIDALVCNLDGTLEIIEGVPSPGYVPALTLENESTEFGVPWDDHISYQGPVPANYGDPVLFIGGQIDPAMATIIKFINVPPEAVAADVTLKDADTFRFWVLQQNALWREVQEIWEDEFPEVWDAIELLQALFPRVDALEDTVVDLQNQIDALRIRWVKLTKVANFTAGALVSDHRTWYECDTSGGDIVVTLPPCPNNGIELAFHRKGNGRLLIVPNGSETINGFNQTARLPNRSTVVLVANPTGEWGIL